MNRFLKPGSAAPLAFFRIAVASLGLIQGGWLLGNINLLYGPDGLVPWSLSKEIVSPWMPQLSWLQSLATATGTGPDIWVYTLMGLYMFSLLGLLLGNFTRTSAFVAWLLQFMFINTGFMGAYGVETFMHIGLFYCILMPVGDMSSIDSLVKPAVKDNEWNTLSVRVLQFHLCIVYIASGVEKAMGLQWWNGEAIWQTLMQTQFSRFDMHWLAQYPLFAKCIGWSTLIIEIGYPLYMFWPRSRPYGYLAVVLLHLSIAVFMGLQLFAAIMIIFNTAAFGWPYIRQAYAGAAGPFLARRRLRRAGMMATQAFWHIE